MTSSVKFSEIAELVMGQSPKGADCNETGDGFPLLNGPTEFTERSPLPVQFTTAGKKFSKTGDILFCVRGSTTGRMNYADQAYAIGRGIGAIRGINGYPTAYIRAVLEHNLDRLLVAATGSTFPNVGKDLLNNFEVNVCSPEQAQQANKLLVGIEDKRYLNSQTNQTLEEMAQAIFKSWFVDFDPVKAKINGDKPEGMDEATASLFPEKLVESELGLIPDGWEAGTVGSVTTAKGGYAFKSKQFVDEGNPVIKIKNISSSGTVNTLDCQCIDDDIASTASRFKLSNGDLLMAMTGATVGKSGIYVSDGRDSYLNQRVARFESKIDSSNPCWFTYNLVTKDSIFEQIVGAAQGSAQPNISSKGIEQVKAVIPTHDLIGKYQELVAPLYAKWISNFQENSQLAELRDTLLPKLLSGETELG